MSEAATTPPAVPAPAAPRLPTRSLRRRLGDTLSARLDDFRLAIGALSGHPLRSGLTLLGIVIGVFTVVAMMSLLNGLQSSIDKNMGGLGADVFQIQRLPSFNFAEGLETLEETITTNPRHPATYRARYLASLGYEELGNVAKVRQHLNDNLYNFSLTPDSSDWRDSIFLLGRLVYHEALAREAKSRELGVDLTNPELRKPGLKELEQAEALFQEAVRILEEAVERYPTAPETIEARYFLADSHRLAARWPRKRLEGTAIEANRGALLREMQAELAAALKEYALLMEKLSGDHDGESSEAARAIMRNCYFARADVLFDQGKIAEALAAYSAATSRYQHDPEALEAYVQIAACYRRLGRSAEARGTLEQARVVLSRMKPETNFTKTTPYSRDEWTRLLTWLSAL